MKGTVITGTSDQMLMSTSNPSVWENSTYQTVLSSGGADYARAYIKLNWSDSGSLRLKKTVSGGGSLSGWTFYFKNNSTGETTTKTTGSDGTISITGLTAGTTYTVTEKAYSGYIQPAAQTVTIQAGKTTEISFNNVPKQWKAVVTKVDAETGTAQGNASLDGAQYTLYKSGKAVKTYTIRNGSFTTDSYPCTANDGVYTLKETKAPPGYKLDPTVYKLTTGYSHYTAAENNIKLTVSDEIIKGKITVEKWAANTISEKKQPEKGATFHVWIKSAGSYAKAKAAERDIITIGTDGKGSSKDLPYGTYCVQQATTWDGYDLDTAIYERTIDGTAGGANDTLSLHNDIWTGQLTISKVDGDSKKPLAGAEFTLTGTDGSKVTLVTDSAGKAVFGDLVYGGEYQTILDDDCTTNTVIHYHAVIRRALQSAVRKDILLKNVADQVDRPKKNVYHGTFYSEEEMMTLFDAVSGDPLELCVKIAAYYGLRRSEVLGLKWDAIDLENKTISISHKVIEAKVDGKFVPVGEDVLKTKSSFRTLPLIPVIEQLLLEEKEKQEIYRRLFKKAYCRDYLDYICLDQCGKLMRPNFVTEHFTWIIQKYGLRKIRFHDLRHTCASLLLKNGIAMKQIQIWLGHSTFSTTADIYAHLDFSAQKESANAMSEMFTRNQEAKETAKEEACS